MGFETSDMNELIETMAQDVSPDEVERMLQDEARMLFSQEDEEGGVIPDSVKQKIRNYLDKNLANAEAKNKEYQERGESSWIGVADPDAIMDELERYNPGINTFEDYLNYEDYQTFYDMYKDYHGISPRWTTWKDSDNWSGEIDSLQAEFKEEDEKAKKESNLEYEHFGSHYGSGGDVPREPNKKFKAFAKAAGEQDLYSDELPSLFRYNLQGTPEMEDEMDAAWKDNYRLGQQGSSATPQFDNTVSQALQAARSS
jgi:hypothetical protein